MRTAVVLTLGSVNNANIGRAVFRKVAGSASLDALTYERAGDVLKSEVAFTTESKRTALKFEMRRIADR